MAELLAAVRRTGFFHSHEDYLLDRVELEPVPINISVSRVHAASGELGLVVARDISERKAAERTLRQFNDELERRVLQQTEELQEFASALEKRVAERTFELEETNSELAAYAHSVSHDLRAPLRAMEGFATALLEEYGHQLEGYGHEYIQHIIDSASRLDLLVTDLLAYSRLGRAQLPLSVIDLKSVVTESLRQLSSDIEACQAKVDVMEQMPSILGDKTTLRQIVTNLLSNAIKFVSQGVRPKVRVWAERKEDGYVRLSVEDNGIGIEDKYQNSIFGVFERLHGVETYGGTGIGLAIVARSCKRIGGRFGVDSRPAHGSCFWAEFRGGGATP